MYPKLLHIYGSLSINGYGLMIALGFLLFLYLSYKNPKRSKIISSDLFFNTIFIGLLAAIVGGRIFFVIEEFNSYSDNWLEMFYPWVGGYGLLGSVIGVLMTVPVYLRIKKTRVLPFLDLISIYAPLMQSISRIGCFLAGCCYGCSACSRLPWAVVFTSPDSLAPLNVSLHPAQLYSTLVSFLIFLIVLFSSKFKYKTGQLLFLYLVLESIARFFVDFWRGNRDYVHGFSLLNSFSDILSFSQLVAIGIFVFASIGFLWVSFCKNPSKE